MNITEALARVVAGRDLAEQEMHSVMLQIMSGDAGEAQIGAFLVALRMKGESLDEITGAVRVMRQLAKGVEVRGEHVVDIVGTGGDNSNLFNVSTAACFVVAAAGGRVAKHGNRSVSSNSGSADLLEAAGVKLDLEPEQVARCVDEVGVGFMFAPAHHSAMRHAIGPRKQLGLRTIFNILGPMTNPAGVRRQLIGVYDRALCRPMAEVLGRLGAEHVMVVNAEDGLDEISIAATTHVAEFKEGQLKEYSVTPEDAGITTQSLDGLAVKGAEESLALIQAALGNDGGTTAEKARDLIALNSGAALYVADLVPDLAAGVLRARALIASGAALKRLNQLAELSQAL